MKRVFVFAMLSALSMVGVVAEAQQHYNHNPSANNNTFPFNVAQGKRVQWIVAAGEFSQPAPAPGGTITSIWFRASGSGNATYTTLTIRMATVPTTTFLSIGAFYSGPMTTLLSQDTTLAPVGALTWFEIPLTTPFTYDPTMNLVVEVSHCGYSGSGFNLPQAPLSLGLRRQYSTWTSPCGGTAEPSGGDYQVAGIGISMNVVAAPPTIAKSFGAVSIARESTTTMTITLANPNPASALTGVGVSDTFPAGLVVATPNGLVNTCNVSPTAVAGAGAVSLTGATLTANASCSFTVNVRGTTLGVKTNTTGAVSSIESGPGGTGSATVTVLEPVPTLTTWALALLAAMLALTTMFQVRQRPRVS